MAEEGVIILVRREDRETPFKDSIEWVASCGHECWMGPEMQVAVVHHQTPDRTLCIQCAANELDSPELLHLIPRGDE